MGSALSFWTGILEVGVACGSGATVGPETSKDEVELFMDMWVLSELDLGRIRVPGLARGPRVLVPETLVLGGGLLLFGGGLLRVGDDVALSARAKNEVLGSGGTGVALDSSIGDGSKPVADTAACRRGVGYSGRSKAAWNVGDKAETDEIDDPARGWIIGLLWLLRVGDMGGDWNTRMVTERRCWEARRYRAWAELGGSVGYPFGGVFMGRRGCTVCGGGEAASLPTVVSATPISSELNVNGEPRSGVEI